MGPNNFYSFCDDVVHNPVPPTSKDYPNSLSAPITHEYPYVVQHYHHPATDDKDEYWTNFLIDGDGSIWWTFTP